MRKFEKTFERMNPWSLSMVTEGFCYCILHFFPAPWYVYMLLDSFSLVHDTPYEILQLLSTFMHVSSRMRPKIVCMACHSYGSVADNWHFITYISFPVCSTSLALQIVWSGTTHIICKKIKLCAASQNQVGY